MATNTNNSNQPYFNPATENIAYWGYFINNGHWYPRRFDEIIIKLLYYAEMGKISKILLSVPSRHGKSTLISKIFASYYMCKYPNEHIILSAYSSALATEFGSEVKTIINYYGQYTRNAPKLSQDDKSKRRFKFDRPYTGQMLAVGSAGSILGFGANLFIVDDPIKNVADAESHVLQEKLKNWFNGTAKTRLERRPNGKPPIMIVIAQRLHINDLHGIIKASEPTIDCQEAFKYLETHDKIPENTWVDLNLQAICTDPEKDILHRERGEVLWEAQRNYEWLISEKKAMGSYLFNAIYQGEPTTYEGNIFMREWFYDTVTDQPTCIINKNEVPDNLPLLRYWDFASSGDDGDETSGVLTGYDGTNIYVLDLVNGKYTASQINKYFKKTAIKDTKQTIIKIEQEPGSASKILINNLKREMKGYTIRSDKVSRAKHMRSFELEAICEDQRFKIVKAQWNTKLIEQLINFTGKEGNSDDIVDSLTGSARHWLKQKSTINI